MEPNQDHRGKRKHMSFLAIKIKKKKKKGKEITVPLSDTRMRKTSKEITLFLGLDLKVNCFVM